MKKSKYNILLLFTLLLYGVTANAQFNPNNPPEPANFYTLALAVSPESAGTASGEGVFSVGSSHYLYATAAEGYAFSHWSNPSGTVVSNSYYFYYIMGSGNTTLTANFVRKYQLTLNTNLDGAGSLSGAGSYVAGRNVTLSASTNTGFRFVNWSDAAGNVISTNAQFTYTTTGRATTLTANYQQIVVYPLTLKANPAGGSNNLYGAGSYEAGKTVSVYCYANSNFVFKNWTAEDGTILSTSTSFTYTTTASAAQLTANYIYSPSNPQEPTVITPESAKKVLTLTASPAAAGYFNYSSGGRYESGTIVSLYAYNNTNYSFVKWTKGGAELSTSRSLSYTISDENNELVAHYQYNPGNPAEPVTPTDESLGLYGLKQSASAGEQLMFNLFLENTVEVKGLQFDATFPAGVTVNTASAAISSRGNGHTLTTTDLGGNKYRFAVTGSLPFTGDNGILLNIPLTTSALMSAGEYTLSFTDAVVTKTDGSTADISAHNGTLEVNDIPLEEINANFSYDKYLNRVSFTNLSSTDATQFFWSFGDGATSSERNPFHIYSAGGNYSVRLIASGVRVKDTLDITVAVVPASQWSLSGEFTLNDEGRGNKNFTTPADLFNFLGSIAPAGNISVLVKDGADLLCTMGGSMNTTLLNLATQLKEKSLTLTLRSTSGATISFVPSESSLSAPAISNLLTLGRSLVTDNVTVIFNGSNLKADVLHTMAYSQRNCTGSATTVTNLSQTGSMLTIDWEAVTPPAEVSGYINSGTGELPVMTILNSATTAKTLKYKVGLLYQNTEVYSFNYEYVVAPALMTADGAAFVTTSPAKGSTSENEVVNLTWKPLTNVTGYDLYLWKEGETASAPYSSGLTTNSRQVTLERGNSYQWTVVGHGECNDLRSDTATFSVVTLNNMNDADYAVLCALYNATGGTGWTKQWNTASKVIDNVNWSGVTFVNKKVTAINLSNSNLTGAVPASLFTLTELTSLNLSNNALTGDLGTTAITSSTLTTLNLSHNQLTGDVYALAGKFANLKTLNLSYNKFDRVSSPLSATVTSLDISHQTLTTGAVLALYGEMSWQMPTLFTYNHSRKDYSAMPTSFSVYNSTIGRDVVKLTKNEHNSYSLSFYNRSLQYASNATLYGWTLPSGTQNSATVSGGGANGSSYPLTFTFAAGDANIDTLITAADVEQTTKYLIDNEASMFNHAAADYNANGKVNVQDMVLVTNRVLNKDVSGYTFDASAANDSLYIEAGEGGAGKMITVPLYLDNTEAVTAVQFTLTVAAGATINTAGVTLTNRKSDHVVKVRDLGNNSYLFIVYSMTGATLSGESGALLQIPMTLGNTWVIGNSYANTFSDILLCAPDGTDVTTGRNGGSITVIDTPSPDFTVSDVSLSPQNFMPGDTVTVTWKVNNAGSSNALDGWSESISLQDGNSRLALLGTATCDSLLKSAASIERTAKMVVGNSVGMEGSVKAYVKVTPYSTAGELPADAANNSASSSAASTLGKLLTLQLPTNACAENSTGRIQCKLLRSGDNGVAMRFTLSCSDAARLNVPAYVDIQAGQSGAIFYISTIDNNVLDSTPEVSIQASSVNGYATVLGLVTIEDNEYPALTITATPSVIFEGDTIKLKVTTSVAGSTDCTLNISSTLSNRFSYPKTVTLPAGEREVEIEVVSTDNEVPNLTEQVTFGVAAAKHNSSECFVVMKDNDMPMIELTLAPKEVSESAGLTAIVATLKRTTNVNKKVTIELSDDSEGDLYYPNRRVTLERGVQEAEFSIGVVDNAQMEGNRKVVVTAAVYVASCNCATAGGEGGGIIRDSVTILDNDGPTLAITTSQATVLEGKPYPSLLTVSRNTETSAALAVTLTCDTPSDFTFEQSVTIPAGQQSVTVPVTVKSNDVSDGDRTAIFTVTSEGYTKGVCWLMVTDQTLPDAVITHLSLSQDSVAAKGSVNVLCRVANKGAGRLASGTAVKLYLSPTAVYNASTAVEVTTLYTSASVVVDDSLTLEQPITMPDKCGDYYLIAVANGEKRITELIYLNNTSEAAKVVLTPPYKATIVTDKLIYTPGEEIAISGRLTGSSTAQADVELYVIFNGTRRILSTTTDDAGEFSYVLALESHEMGHIDLGACYPGEGKWDALAQVNLYGMKRASTDYIKFYPIVNETYNDSVIFKNFTDLPLTGLTAELVSKSDDSEITLSLPSTVAGQATFALDYSFASKSEGTGKDWYQALVRVTSAEGVSVDVTLYYFPKTKKGSMQLSISNITTTMTVGDVRDYSFTITNNGAGETGSITFALPDLAWMKLVSQQEIASLASGESATVVIRLSPKTSDGLQLNVPVSGTLGINPTNAPSKSMYYSITPVSEATGILKVDACDEYTFNTTEAPHLKGAAVKVRRPYSSTVVAEGITGADGLFTVENLAEGWYSVTVTADKHTSYNNNVLVSPGLTTLEYAFLSYSAISYSWNVVETEVEDEYEVVTTVKFETNVPAPVVVVKFPDSIPEKTHLFNVVVTNEGLIAAYNTNIVLPADGYDMTFECMANLPVATLLPSQTIVIPVKATYTGGGDGISTRRKASGDCHTREITINYQARICNVFTGVESFVDKTATMSYSYGNCGGGGYGGGFGGGLGGGLGGPGGPGGDNHSDANASSVAPLVTFTYTGCRPCIEEMIRAALACAPLPGPVGCGVGLATAAYDGSGYAEAAVGCIDPTPISGMIGCAQALADLAACFAGYKMSAPERRGDDTNSVAAEKENMPGYVSLMLDRYEKTNIVYRNTLAFYNEYYHFDELINCTQDELADFRASLQTRINAQGLYEVNDMADIKPASVPTEVALAFVERLNNSTRRAKGETVEGDNYIDETKMKLYTDSIKMVNEEAISLGFESPFEMVDEARNDALEKMTADEASVCTAITLQFSQTITMTRQAFRGTFTLYNGHSTDDIKEINLNISVTDMDGNLMTSHEFQINNESITDFTGDLLGDWSLGAGKTGTATILFIPTKFAAPTYPKQYNFGGTLSYLDPFTGTKVTVELDEVTLTVKPSPDLELTYFMQRDVLGDDALTKDVVEPVKEAEFSVIINNKGYGDATNLKYVTKQPEIIDNERGLLIDFEIVSSSMNGKEKSMALGESVVNEFGTIPAQSTAYAQWYFTSSLMGHFVEYDISYTHVTSYDNPDLSLLDTVTIHELIHSVIVDDSNPDNIIKGFLANDVEDADDTPDMVYYTDGNSYAVEKASSATLTKLNDTQYRLSVSSSSLATLWVYGNVTDETDGLQNIVSVVRESDSKTMNLQNFWQTDRTFVDGKEWNYENRIHFADEMTADTETYLITFEARPDLYLEVESFAGVPTEITYNAITSVTVNFNKVIDEASFTYEDLHLYIQGEETDLSGIEITKVTGTQYSIDLSSLEPRDGYYKLTVQTSAITDNEGFNGKVGKTATWNQLVGGKVNLNVIVTPENSGSVTPDNGAYDFSSIVTLKAKPAFGYDFGYWSIDAMSLSTDTVYDLTLVSNKSVTAHFTPRNFNMTIEYDTLHGNITGGSSGIYIYGTKLRLTANPNNNYKVDYWMVNGQKLAETGRTISVMAGRDSTVYVSFVRKEGWIVDWPQGWSWFSYNLTDALDAKDYFASFATAIEQVQDQENELVKDPFYGLIGHLDEIVAGKGYKIKTLKNVSLYKTGNMASASVLPVSLGVGWNWIGYPSFYEQTLNSALANLQPAAGDVIKSQFDFATYNGTSWVGTLTQMSPGLGYLYWAQAEETFTFAQGSPSPVSSKRNMEETRTLPEMWSLNAHLYANNMTIIAALYDKEVPVTGGEMAVAAFCNGECRGIGKWVDGLLFITLYGEGGSDVIEFMAYDSEQDEILKIDETMIFTSTHTGTLSSPYRIHLNRLTDVSADLTASWRIYPTPVRDRLYIHCAEEIEQVRLTDMSGATLRIVNGYKSDQPIDVSLFADGIYMVTVKTVTGNLLNKKVTIK